MSRTPTARARGPRAAFALAALSTLLAAPAPADATTVLPMSEREMIDASSWIGTGEVTSRRSQWLGRQLWTRIELAVEREMAGERRGERLELVLPGGEDLERGIASYPPGTAVLPVGARILLLGRASQRIDGALEPVSPMQGVALLGTRAGDALLVRITGALRDPAAADAPIEITPVESR